MTLNIQTICDDLKQMFEGLAQEVEPTFGTDYAMRIDNSICGPAIEQAFAPLSSRYVDGLLQEEIIEFSFDDVNTAEPLISHEKREEAYHRIPLLVAQHILSKEGQYSNSLKTASKVTSINEHEIEKLVKKKITQYQTEFSSEPSYLLKNRVLGKMEVLFHTIRKPDTLVKFIETSIKENISKQQYMKEELPFDASHDPREPKPPTSNM